MRIVALLFLIGILAACNSTDEVINPQSPAVDACPFLEIQGQYADTTNGGQANGHSFSWETRNWEVIPAGGVPEARVRGTIDTQVVSVDGMAVPITVSVLTDVDHRGFVVCDFKVPLDRSEVTALDGSSIQSVSGEVSGHFVEGRDPALLNGEYDIQIVLADGRTATHFDSWQASIM